MAVASPLAVIVFTMLTVAKLGRTSGEPASEGETCLRCGKNQPGGEGHFHYTEPVGNARERAAKQQFSADSTPILGSETYFVCDKCARSYLWGQVLQHLLIVLSYPLYLYVILPLVVPDGFIASVGVEIILIILSLSGLIAALDIYRAVRQGSTALDEGRDRVAIGKRRRQLGKKFSYYTRSGMGQLHK
ncbi:hypothetical protein JR338_11240 [Chloroflexota bacterium]|nr:hypothetical protein JR338_11240 [Chloroflexota bacterium]